MDFFIQWVWYALAFLLGSLVAWVSAVVVIKHTSDEEALAHLADAREFGGTS